MEMCAFTRVCIPAERKSKCVQLDAPRCSSLRIQEKQTFDILPKPAAARFCTNPATSQPHVPTAPRGLTTHLYTLIFRLT